MECRPEEAIAITTSPSLTRSGPSSFEASTTPVAVVEERVRARLRGWRAEWRDEPGPDRFVYVFEVGDSDPVEVPEQALTDDLRERGLNPQVKFLERSVGEVTPEESMALNLSPGSGVVRMYRLRHVDGSPIAIERTLVPYALLPDPDSVTTSLYEALDAYGHRPKRALQRLRAVALDEEAARHLELPVGAPGLLVERRAFLEDGRVVESTRSYYRGDAYDFVAELQSD